MDKKALVAQMKEQTIGVEVEMNNISRRDAAKAAAEYFGTGRYGDTHMRNSYSAWSAWDRTGREWKFVSDSSIHGPFEERCEMVTPVLHYEDMDLLQGLIRVLRKAGGKSCPSRGCGVHIHIGGDGHTAQSLRNLANIMASHEGLLCKAIDVAWDRQATYCKAVDQRFLKELNEKKPQTLAELADIWYGTQAPYDRRDQHYNSSRYHMLNLHAFFTKGTVEFRLFQFDEASETRKGGLHAGQLKSFIQLCLAMNQMAKMLTTVRVSDKTRTMNTENSKFAMRSWLHAMGLTGDEFKTLRDTMAARLEGSSRWRYGEQRNREEEVA